MACGLLAALSVIFTDAVRLPDAEGVKTTVKVQLAPGATELPHWSVRTKSAALRPVKMTPVMFRVALPLLVKVTL
jgi:hypothetical protein